MLLRKNLLLFIILVILLLCSLHTISQSDSIKLHKIKFDWELGPPGAGVNFSIHSNLKNSFGIGLNALYANFVLLPPDARSEASAINWDFLNCKLFYRNVLSKRFTFEYSLKFGYSNLVQYGNLEDSPMVGIHFASIIGNKRAKYKPMIALVQSVEGKTIFLYIIPLVFNYKI